MIQQDFLAKIDNVSVLDKIGDVMFSSEMGRTYDTISFTYNAAVPPALKAPLTFELGDMVFNGFVYQTSKTGHDKWQVHGRSNTAKLTLPFSQPKKIIEPYDTASSLLAYYGGLQNIQIDYQSAELSFGAGFERDGTPNDMVLKIAAVTGSDVYVNGDTLVIAPLEELGTPTTVYNKSDYFDVALSTDDLQSAGIGKVIVSDGEGAGTFDQRFSFDIRGKTITFFPVPYREFSVIEGVINLTETTHYVEETFEIVDEDSIDLKGVVDQITRITLTGVDISYDEIDGSFVYFTERITGLLMVRYLAKVYQGKLKTRTTPDGAYYFVKVSHNGEIHTAQGLLHQDADGAMCDWVSNANDETMLVCAPAEKNYVRGFSLYTMSDDGLTPLFKFRYDGEPMDVLFIPPVESDENFIAVEEVTLYPYSDVDPKWVAAADLNIAPDAIEAVYTSESDQLDTTMYHLDGKLVKFDKLYHEVRISYVKAAKKYYFQSDNINATLKLMIAASPVAGWLEYDLIGFDKYDLQSYPCSLPANLPVDIAGTREVPVSDTVNKNIHVTFRAEDADSDIDIGTYVVDSFGFIFVHCENKGQYKCDTSSITNGTFVILTVATDGT